MASKVCGRVETRQSQGRDDSLLGMIHYCVEYVIVVVMIVSELEVANEWN
jgi:hypothetical protein